MQDFRDNFMTRISLWGQLGYAFLLLATLKTLTLGLIFAGSLLSDAAAMKFFSNVWGVEIHLGYWIETMIPQNIISAPMVLCFVSTITWIEGCLLILLCRLPGFRSSYIQSRLQGIE